MCQGPGSLREGEREGEGTQYNSIHLYSSTWGDKEGGSQVQSQVGLYNTILLQRDLKPWAKGMIPHQVGMLLHEDWSSSPSTYVRTWGGHTRRPGGWC